MSHLTAEDRELLRKLDQPCLFGCGCDVHHDGLANVLRLHGADLDREQLLKLLLEIGRYLALVTETPTAGESVVGIIGGATAELAKDTAPSCGRKLATGSCPDHDPESEGE